MIRPTGLRRTEEGSDLPLLCERVAMPELPDDVLDLMTGDIDERTAAYVLAARPVFDGFNQAASRLAGLLVLAAIGGRDAQSHPILDLARDAHAEAADLFGRLTPTLRASHHHRHLGHADSLLRRALRTAREAPPDRDRLTTDVKPFLAAAIDHLRWAGDALPGFEIVAFGRACCASHAMPKPKQQPSV